METRLGNHIEGCCVGLEQRMTKVEQRADECLISLEMACTESETGRAAIEKQFDGLKLEVHRINHFLEKESMVNHQDKQGILGTTESGRKLGSTSGNPCIHAQGTPNAGPHGANGFLDVGRPHQFGGSVDSARASQGHLLKLQFLVFGGGDPQLWRSRCENYFEMYAVEQ
jgi:hypothetical protein